MKDFREWFGNSKVVDNGGCPQIVYHGTYKRFSEFKIGESRQRAKENLSKRGFWFGSSVRQVEPYTGEGENHIIIPAYLKIENPLYLNVDDFLEWHGDDGPGAGVRTKLSDEDIADIMQEHDGIIFEPATREQDEEFGLGGEWSEPQYVVFDPANIWRIDRDA